LYFLTPAPRRGPSHYISSIIGFISQGDRRDRIGQMILLGEKREGKQKRGQNSGQFFSNDGFRSKQESALLPEAVSPRHRDELRMAGTLTPTLSQREREKIKSENDHGRGNMEVGYKFTDFHDQNQSFFNYSANHSRARFVWNATSSDRPESPQPLKTEGFSARSVWEAPGRGGRGRVF
jgi:hypothetical protein